jgi:hypothetical protein
MTTRRGKFREPAPLCHSQKREPHDIVRQGAQDAVVAHPEWVVSVYSAAIVATALREVAVALIEDTEVTDNGAARVLFRPDLIPRISQLLPRRFPALLRGSSHHRECPWDRDIFGKQDGSAGNGGLTAASSARV